MSAASSEDNFWLIKRNCSAGPRQLALVFGSIVAVSFLFGVSFAAFGLWMVLPFVGIELIAVGLAFFCYARHAADYERISVTPRAVSVEQVDGSLTKHWSLSPRSSHVHVDASGHQWDRRVHVYLRDPDFELEVGRHLLDVRRRQLGRELAGALARARTLPAVT